VDRRRGENMTTIMIVEDESIVAEDIRKSLETLGYAVSAVVPSGEKALQQAEKENPDLILMDIVLRGDMDGIDVAEQLKLRFDIPVVYLTAYSDDKKLQRALMTEPYGYILKPFEDRELHTIIEMALYKYRMEKKLKESEQWLATTLRSIGDGVITTDTEGVVTFMNPVAEALTGWTQKEATGVLLSDVFCIINEETRVRCENPFERILETGGIVGLANNTVLVARDGTERLIADSGAPIRDNDSILGTVLVFRDVTEKRRMEDDILRLQTEKMESISVLAGGIAHDFNNILTSILGNITLAKIHADPADDIVATLTEAEKASLRAKNLTQQLLTFSKEGVLIKKFTSISELLRDTAQFTLRGSNVGCRFCISDDLWPVEIDAGQISQVINNLIINADQAMPRGGMVTVEAENVTVGYKEQPMQQGTYVKISITDEGVGIPCEHLQRIFDPYFTTKQKGTGLGLAISFSIIRNHDGHITVESEPGAGTTFSIWLPASEKAVIPLEKGMEELAGNKKGEGRILLMDDDWDILRVTRDVLNYLGYDTVLARNGKEAVDVYMKALKESESFDVVILDLTVQGGMGGKETIQKLKEIDPEVKAVISSGYSNDPVTAHYREYGFSSAITKPYSIDELKKALQSVMQNK
jgi:PAS domain S-box-containing protein